MSVLIFILTVIVGIVILGAGCGMLVLSDWMEWKWKWSTFFNFLSSVTVILAGGIIVIGVVVTFLLPWYLVEEYNHTYKTIEVYDKEGTLKETLSGEDLFLDSENGRIHYTDASGNDVYYYFDNDEDVVKGVK